MSALRVVVVWLLTAATLMLLGALLPGLEVKDALAALAAAAVIGLLNAFVYPLLIRIALPLTVLTLGLGAIVLNGLLVLFVGSLEPGFAVNDLGTGIVVALGITIVNTGVSALLAIDDDDFWYRNVVRRQARRAAGVPETDVPGLFFIEIDG